MKRHRPSLLPPLFVCGMLACAGIVGAQPTDRILAFDSRITVDRDRTMHFRETFAITNDTGLFDDGFHRRLRIKPANPQRVKPGSFQSVVAQVDGHRARVSTSQDGDVFDIRIASEAGTLTRIDHVVELTYTAKYQFAIYRTFEDLNHDMSGEWPVSIEKATVELNFPDRLPGEAGITADTGTDSNFNFDCVRTDFTSGVKFQTTHSIARGSRLFVSARFPHSGYFVSNVKDDGWRAFLENHPLFVPSLASLCGFGLFAAVGSIVWRRAPGGVDSASTAPRPSSLTLWSEVAKTYGFPMVMFAVAIIPGFNSSYSGHGGASWFLVPLCFPWVLARMLFKIAMGSAALSIWYKRFFTITIPSYVVVALPLSWAAATSIHKASGLPISTWDFFVLMVSPLPWAYFT